MSFTDISKPLSINDSKNLGANNTCYYCGKKGETTGDHFYPKSKGGRLKVRSCKKCNEEKGSMTPLVWLFFINGCISHCKENMMGCPRGEFIKSRCDPDCKELKKLERMKQATLSLWERVKWSVNKEYYY